jgi:hypothetical protein
MAMRLEMRQPRKRKNGDLKDRCIGYIRRTATLPEAQALAKKDGFSANTSVWLGAFAEMLGGRFLPRTQ